MAEPGDRLLEFEPPQTPAPGRVIGGDEHGPGCAVPAKHRPGVVAVVPVAVVKG
jgi:hypothetical protein